MFSNQLIEEITRLTKENEKIKKENVKLEFELQAHKDTMCKFLSKNKVTSNYTPLPWTAKENIYWHKKLDIVGSNGEGIAFCQREEDAIVIVETMNTTLGITNET